MLVQVEAELESLRSKLADAEELIQEKETSKASLEKAFKEVETNMVEKVTLVTLYKN